MYTIYRTIALDSRLRLDGAVAMRLYNAWSMHKARDDMVIVSVLCFVSSDTVGVKAVVLPPRITGELYTLIRSFGLD